MGKKQVFTKFLLINKKLKISDEEKTNKENTKKSPLFGHGLAMLCVYFLFLNQFKRAFWINWKKETKNLTKAVEK